MRHTIRLLLLALLGWLPAGCVTPPIGGQGPWTADDRDYFYYTSQGSRLVPRAWLLALERHDAEALFLADGLARYGYLPGTRTARNPDGLPVGFAVDTPETREWIGMTCAACHTSEISYQGQRRRVEGGPASADMFEFLADLDIALRRSAADDAVFARFAERVLGAQATDMERGQLRAALRSWSAGFARFVQDSTPRSPWGPTRLDAFGMIFNRVSAIDLGIPQNSRPPNAPVSYPFLWGTSWHDWTQWNGAVENGTALRRLGRNVGQVLGVFGTLDVGQGGLGYPSSARRSSLMELEERVSRLTAPEWPADLFGAPDAARAARGEVLYRDNCSGCHHLVAKDQQLAPVKTFIMQAARVGTDDTMTREAATRRALSGPLQGRVMDLTDPNRLIGTEELVAELLAHVVQRAVIHVGSDAPEPFRPADVSQHGFKLRAARVTLGNYKARPLNGVWATGPYLHNGSVRTLWQLLQPPAQREAAFYVGSREFDPVQVGFVNAPGTIVFELDTRVPGNRNGGHLYGTALTDEQKRDLIEYMKTL